ncbi:hypothetical protein HAX54_007488, partial [Datura stramonium]|nr:hypothetical protein [Datura stramonium]
SARRQAIGATGRARQQQTGATRRAARSKAGTMPGARRPAPLRVGRCDTGHLQRVGRRAAAHSPCDKACDAVLGHGIDKRDAARFNKRPKLTSHFNYEKEL